MPTRPVWSFRGGASPVQLRWPRPAPLLGGARLTALVCAFALAACRGDAARERPASVAEPPPPSPPVAAGETWNGIALYPGSRQLCDEHVTARPTTPHPPNTPWREIDWRSYATSDPADRVVAFFDPEGKYVEAAEAGETTLRRDGVRISVFTLPASRPAPTCAVPPASGDRALIVLHKQTVSGH